MEVGVQIVECRILARLRHQVFFSLAELNRCIRTLVAELNERPFKKLPGNRREAFERLDRPALRALPVQPWRYRHIKKAKLNIDYHVEYEQHHYPVPHHYSGKMVELHAYDNLLEVWAEAPVSPGVFLRVTVPQQSSCLNATGTLSNGRQSWAACVGSDTLAWVSGRLAEKAHPEQACRLCLTREYPSERVTNSCRLANAEGLTG